MKKSVVIGALGALAQETRLDIFRLLIQKGPEGMPGGDIGARLGQLSPTPRVLVGRILTAAAPTDRRLQPRDAAMELTAFDLSPARRYYRIRRRHNSC